MPNEASQPLVLIGAGVIGKRHLAAAQSSAKAHFVAIVDPAPGALETAQTHGLPHYPDLASLRDNIRPTGAVISTPTEHHLSPALNALDANLHVLVEKPITATLDEADHIIARSDATGLAVLVGHHRRYYPQVDAARTMVRDGTLGQLVAVSGQWCLRKHESYFNAQWRKRWQAGPVLTNLSHDMDHLRYICGEVSHIQAETTNAVQGFEKEDAAALILRFENGALGSFILSDQAQSPWGWEFATGENAALPPTGENALRIMGTLGSLEIPNLRLWKPDGAPDWRTPMQVTETRDPFGDAFIRQIDHFADVIAGRAAPKITARDATATLRATVAVLDAARSGRRIAL